ncbi:C-C chemokine receptor type 5 isoform X2 [Lampris incognitus]|uniref:C-C chemokine receptor type 5 isoform X2 n=1 Tax=Lampris incognitus TaxID=2546036 RepID=UPI0024B5B042|nr:C-C chemokine receptor type 5 isoform X2 [Lampris incognitus]
MDDSEPNSTTLDYGDYYDSTADYSPCNNSNVRDFGKVFLPTLYTLVFITGFIDFLCRFVTSIFTLGFYNSTFIMVVMTLDRYVVIVHAHTLAHHRTLRVGMALTVFVWLLSMCISLPYMIFTQVRNDSSVLRCDYYTDSQGWKDFNILAMNIFGLLLPLLIMVACYSRIICTLVGMRSTKRHRSIKLIIIIVVIFFLFWAPYNITLFLTFLQSGKLLGNYCQREEAISFSIQVTETIAFTHCCLNPIIYAFVGQKFMRRVQRLLRNWFPCCSLLSSRDMSESSARSSVMSRPSDVTSTVVL